jgi:ribosomal protein S18 acetylase RimI-like enzyme
MAANFELAITQHIIDLLVMGDEFVGLVEVIPHKQYLLIENLAVEPHHQGEGFGDLLLQHAETIARSHKLDEVRLYTNAAFVSNISFYGKRGYVEFAREPIPTGGIVVHMKKRPV